MSGGSPIQISNGADKTVPTASLYPNGIIPISFTANVPVDPSGKIYRVKFRIQRRLNSAPYTIISRGDPDYSEWCDADMYYNTSFIGYGNLN